MRNVALCGVPSSAGAHFPGQEKAPGALRAAGLARLGRVIDYGDIAMERFRPDVDHPRARNADAVIRVAQATRDLTRVAFANGHLPLVIGGDCSIAVGVVAAFVEKYDDGALVYFDGHADLNTPLDSRSGILDSMALAHIVNEKSTVAELAGIGRTPLLTSNDIVLFGANQREMNAAELAHARRFSSFPLERVRRNARSLAREVLHKFESAGRRYLVHFDVDVVDFADLSLANTPQMGDGLSFDDASAALETFASSPFFAGLIVTEVNPDHGDVQGAQIDKLVAALSRIFDAHGRVDGERRLCIA